MRKLLIGGAACAVVITAVPLAGPVSSGAMLLLLPSLRPKVEHDLPVGYMPLQEGYVNLRTGRYIRENEDLVVRGTPPLILRRAYISGVDASMAFGVGATNAVDWYVAGDGGSMQLTRPWEPQVRFVRTSTGASYENAMYEHDGSLDDWNGARVGWTGRQWALRTMEGSLFIFQPCGPRTRFPTCAIVWERDADGHVVHYRRGAQGQLLKIETEDNRWIAFDYDERHRIVRAHTSTSIEARYEYDARGRLARVTHSDARVWQYTYTDRDEMATIVEPGTTIENAYDQDGRCVRQTTRNRDGLPYALDYSYVTKKNAIVEAASTHSDGTWIRRTFDENRYLTSETWGTHDRTLAAFTYERDPKTHDITALALTCPDRRGHPLRHPSFVRDGNEEWLKRDLLQTRCSWKNGGWAH